MYFTRQTEIAISILTICARRSGNYISTPEMAEHIGASERFVASTASMLVQSGLLHRERAKDGRVQLSLDPQSVTLATILRITQPDLVQRDRGELHIKPFVNVFDLMVEAASFNFVRLAERYTVADFVAERNSLNRSLAPGRSSQTSANRAERGAA